MNRAFERGTEIKALLKDEPGLTQGEIAGRLGVSRASVCQAVKGLTDAKEVEGEKTPEGVKLRLSSQAMRRRLISELWR